MKMSINIFLIYSSLNYLKSNFKLTVSLSNHIYNVLKTIRFIEDDTIYQSNDIDIIDELIELEPDVKSLVYHFYDNDIMQDLTEKTLLSLITRYEPKSVLFIDFFCCSHSSVPLKLVLSKKASIITNDMINKGLAAACADNDNPEIVQLLIDHGADISENNIIDLHMAAVINCNYHICKLLANYLAK